MEDHSLRHAIVTQLEALLELAENGEVHGIAYVVVRDADEDGVQQQMEYEHIVTAEADVPRLLAGIVEQQARFLNWVVSIRDAASLNKRGRLDS